MTLQKATYANLENTVTLYDHSYTSIMSVGELNATSDKVSALEAELTARAGRTPSRAKSLQCQNMLEAVELILTRISSRISELESHPAVLPIGHPDCDAIDHFKSSP